MPAAAHADIGAAVAFAQNDGDARHRYQGHRVHEVHDPARRAHALGVGADGETGRVDELHDGYVERVAHHQEIDDLLACLRVQRAAAMLRVVGYDADGLPVKPRQRGDRRPTETGFELEDAVLVEDRLDDLLHVVDLGAFFRQDLMNIRHILARSRRHVAHRRRFHVVARQVAEEGADGVESFLVRIDDHVDLPCRLGMQFPATELLQIDRLADGAADQARTRHSHGRTTPHHCEVRAADQPGRRSEREAERRRRPGRIPHALELRDVVAEQRAHAARAHRVRQPRAGRLADEHDRHAAFRAGPFDLSDLLAVGRACRRPLDGEVVDDERDVAVVDFGVSRDFAVGRRRVMIVRVDARGAEQAGLEKTAFVDEIFDPLARVQLARIAALGELLLAAHRQCFPSALLEFRDFGVDIRQVIGHMFLRGRRPAPPIPAFPRKGGRG